MTELELYIVDENNKTFIKLDETISVEDPYVGASDEQLKPFVLKHEEKLRKEGMWLFTAFLEEEEGEESRLLDANRVTYMPWVFEDDATEQDELMREHPFFYAHCESADSEVFEEIVCGN